MIKKTYIKLVSNKSTKKSGKTACFTALFVKQAGAYLVIFCTITKNMGTKNIAKKVAANIPPITAMPIAF